MPGCFLKLSIGGNFHKYSSTAPQFKTKVCMGHQGCPIQMAKYRLHISIWREFGNFFGNVFGNFFANSFWIASAMYSEIYSVIPIEFFLSILMNSLWRFIRKVLCHFLWNFLRKLLWNFLYTLFLKIFQLFFKFLPQLI